MWAPVLSRPNRIANAQPPANAAPNTSAPIRIAALMTVMTLGQTIRRAAMGKAASPWAQVLFRPAISSESPSVGQVIKRQPKRSTVLNGSYIENGNLNAEPKGTPYSGVQLSNPACDAVAGAVRDAALRRDRARSISCPPSSQAFADHAAEIAASSAIRPRRISPTPSRRWSAPASCSPGCGGVLRSVSAHSNPAPLEIDKEVSLRMARALEPDHDERGAVRPHRAAVRAARRARPDTPEQMRLLERTYTVLPCAPAPRSTRPPRSGMAEITSGWRCSAPPSATICSPTNRTGSWHSARPIWPDCPTSSPRAQAAAASAAWPARRIVTLSRSLDRAVPEFSARRDLREKVFKAFIARGDNGNANDNNAIIAEILQLRAEQAKLLGYSDFRRTTGSRIPWRRRRKPCAACWSGSGRRRGHARWPTATRCRRWSRRRAAISRSQPWDWRYYAEKLRQRRCDFDDAAHQALSGARPHDRGRVRLAHPPVRAHFLERTDMPVWHPGRAGLGGHATPAAAQSALFYRRLFRAALQAQRRLDDLVARPAEARRRDRAADRQCLQFRQGRRRRAALLSLRRRPHPVPRIRPCAARPAVATCPIRRFRAPACSPISSNCRRSFTSIGWSSRRCCGSFARHYQTGEPMPEDLLQTAARAAQLQPGLCHRRIRRLGARRSRVPFAQPAPATSTCARSSAPR